MEVTDSFFSHPYLELHWLLFELMVTYSKVMGFGFGGDDRIRCAYDFFPLFLLLGLLGHPMGLNEEETGKIWGTDPLYVRHVIQTQPWAECCVGKFLWVLPSSASLVQAICDRFLSRSLLDFYSRALDSAWQLLIRHLPLSCIWAGCPSSSTLTAAQTVMYYNVWGFFLVGS